MDTEPVLIKAGDPRVKLSGLPPRVDCRVVAEGLYSNMKIAYDEKIQRVLEDKFHERKGLNLRFVICRVFGHRYEVTRIVTPQIKELRCKRCGKMFAINSDVKVLLPLDKELIDAHNVLLHGI